MSHGALVGRALALLRQDDPSGALECANEVLESIRSGSPDKAAEISALCACVDAHVALGDATKALAKAEEASSLAKSLTTSFAEAAPSLAMVKVKLMASQESKEALALLREIGASWGETALLLALALRAAKEPAQARSLLERARRLQQRWQETFALLTLAVAALSKGSPAMAEIDKFLAVAKKHGLHIGDVDPASSVRRLQGSSTMEDMQEIHDRLSAAAKAGQRSAQAWATLDLADAKLGQGLMKVQELEDATTQLQKIGSKEGLAMAKFQASRSHLACGRPIEALADALVAAKNFKDLGDAVGEAAACSACALAHLELGQLPEAVSLASKAPQDLAERGLRRACADALRVASQVYLQLGEQERAMQVGLEAAAALRDVGDSRGEAFALLNEVASAYVFRKEVDSALNVASASLRLLRAAEDLPGELAALKATAALHLCRGDTEPALRLLQEVISLSHDSGDVSDEVDAHVSCARLRVLRCEAAEATLSAEAAVKAASTEMTEAKALLGMAKVLGAKEEMSAAREAAQKAAALFKQKGYCSGEFLALDLAWQCSAEATKLAQQSAQAFHSSGDLCSAAKAQLSASRHALRARSADVATAAAEKALQIFRELKHTKGEAEALQSLSAAEAARGRPSSSIKAAVDMVALYTRRGDLRGQAEATCRLAKVYLDLGMLKDALSEVGEARLLFQKLPPQLEEAQLLLEVAIPTHGAMENPPKAVAMAEDAANICRSLGDRVGEAKAFKACAKVCVQKNDTKSALQASRQAAAVLSRARLAREEAEAYHLTAKIHLLRLEPREAVSSAAQALTLLRRPGDEDEKAAVLVTASYAHGMAMEYDGAVGTASEAVDLCRRTGNKRRLKMAMHALAEGYLIKGDYGQALDLAEEAQHKDAQDKILEARLLEVSCYARLGWSSSKKKGLRANVRDMLQKAQAASAILVAAGNKRQEADAKFLMGKVQLQAGNLHAAIKEVTKAYDAYGALKDGQGVGWTGLLYAACLLRSPAKLVAGRESAVTSKEIEIPQYDGALHSALVAHSTFRRIEDEEGTEAALKVVNEIRSLQEGSDRSLHKDMPRPRPLPPAFSSAPTAVVHPYHELVGGRQLPFQVPDLQVPPPETETEAEKPSATEAVAAAAIRSLGDRVSEAKALGAIQPLQKNDTKSALQSALVAQSTFRRIEDEEGTEAALKVVNEIRSWQEGSD